MGASTREQRHVRKLCRRARNVYAPTSDTAQHGATLGCKACPFVSRRAKSSVRRSDECRQRVMEAVETDDSASIRVAGMEVQHEQLQLQQQR